MFEGFRVYNTGGGCEALMRELQCGAFVLITDDNMCPPSDESFYIVVGFYRDEDTLNDGVPTRFVELDRHRDGGPEAARVLLSGVERTYGAWK